MTGLDEVRAPMTAYAQKLEDIRREEQARIAREAAERARILAEEAAEAARLEAERQAAMAPVSIPADDAPPPVTLDDAIAAQQQADIEQRRADARPADFSRTRGEFGAVSSLVERIEVRAIDMSLCRWSS